MKPLSTLPLLALLAACSGTPDTPHGQFLKADQAYQATLRVAITYVRECNALPRANPCHDTKPAIAEALEESDAAFEAADAILSSEQVTNYHIALIAAEKALNKLAKAYMERNPL